MAEAAGALHSLGVGSVQRGPVLGVRVISHQEPSGQAR